MDAWRPQRGAQQGCTRPVLESLDAGLSPTACARRAAPTSQPLDYLHPTPLSMANLLLQRQYGTAKNLARAEDRGTGHERPQKNSGEVFAQLRRAREGVRRDMQRALEEEGFERQSQAEKKDLRRLCFICA